MHELGSHEDVNKFMANDVAEVCNGSVGRDDYPSLEIFEEPSHPLGNETTGGIGLFEVQV